MDVEKEKELLELRIKELELRREIEKYKEKNPDTIKIPEIIKIPIIIPECPPKPCPRKEQPIYPYRPWQPVWIYDPHYSPRFDENTSRPMLQGDIITCTSSGCTGD